jgi:hypothetical protein
MVLFSAHVSDILRESVYVENVHYFSLNSALVGKTLTFTRELTADTLYQLRVLRDGRTMEEYWKKINQ